MDVRVRRRAPDRRPARPAHPPRPHPRDERRQLPSRPLQAPLTPASSRRYTRSTPSGLTAKARRPPISGAFLLAMPMDFCSGPPMQFLSGVDIKPRIEISFHTAVGRIIDALKGHTHITFMRILIDDCEVLNAEYQRVI